MSKATNFRQPRRLCPKHLGYIRSLDCCVCGAPAPSDAHHLRINRNGGHTLRADDRDTVPLCQLCHTDGQYAIHRTGSDHEISWFALRSKSITRYVSQLWQSGPHKDTEHDKPPQRVKTQTRKKTAQPRSFQQKTGSKSKPDHEKSKRHWPSSQPIRPQGFSKRKRKISGGRKFNGTAVKYE